jgi:SAM-dependent methyltransferase
VDRSFETEILDCDGAPEGDVAHLHRNITRIHRLLGDTASVISAVRRDPLPVRRVLDVGCGHGEALREVRRRLAVEVIGVDLRTPARRDAAVEIVRADAVVDQLPKADVAFSMYLGHHLSERELVKLIRNVGRSCRRFILLDLVRHRLPLALFRYCVAPFFSRNVSVDGQISIRRSYTPAELASIASAAVAGTGARFRHSVAPLYARQVLDIEYAAA